MLKHCHRCHTSFIFINDETADAIIKQCQSFIENPEQNFLIQCFSEKLNDVKELSKDDKILLEEKPEVGPRASCK